MRGGRSSAPVPCLASSGESFTSIMTSRGRAVCCSRRCGETDRVDGLDPLKQFGGFACFVGLQVSDEVEDGFGEIGQFGSFLFELLDVVFAEVA